MRTCPGCGKKRDTYTFSPFIDKDTGKGYSSKICNNCRYEKQKEYVLDQKLQRLYGITRGQWELILKSQDNKCKICGKEFDGKIDVDHDHKTQIVRGLLCSNCNRGLGQFEDDPERLRKAAKYLETANALKEISSKHS